MLKLKSILIFGTVLFISWGLSGGELFTKQCLDTLPEKIFRDETEQRLRSVQKKADKRKVLIARLQKAKSFRTFAVTRRAELTDSLMAYMRRRLDSGDKGMLLLAWSAIDQLRFLDEYFDQESALLEQQLNSKQGKVFNVKDFGAKGNGKGDDGPAIRKAVAAALAEKVPSTVFLPAGTYRIQPIDHQLKEYLNRQTGRRTSWGRERLSRAHLLIFQPDRLTIAGENGTKLLFTDPSIGGLRLIGSYNTRVSNLTIDYETLPFTQGKIIGWMPDGLLEIEIDEGFPSPMLPNFLNAPSRRLTLIDPKTGNFGQETFFLGRVKALSGRRFAVEFRKIGSSHADKCKKAVKGMLFDITGRYDHAIGSAVSSMLSRFDEFEKVVIHASPSFDFQMNCDGAILKSCRVEPAPGRLVTGNADGLMNNTHRIGPCIENCVFSSNEDDGFNVTTQTPVINDVSPDGRVTDPKAGMSSSGIILIDGDSGVYKAAARVVKQGGSLVYDPALPVSQVRSRKSIAQKKAEDRLTQIFREEKTVLPDRLMPLYTSGGTVISNTRYHNIRGLGIQITGPSVLVENCTIDTMTACGIAVTALPSWGMYFSAYNVILRNNTIRNTKGVPIVLKVFPPYSTGKISVSSLNGILIEKNSLQAKQGSQFLLENCFDVIFRGNTGMNGKLLETITIK